MDREKALRTIEEIIGPFIGPHMARAATRVQCEKLGIVSDQVAPDQLRAVVDRIAGAMTVFVGREKAEELMRRIDEALGLESGKP